MKHIIDCEKFALAAVSSIDGELDASTRASHAIDVYEEAYESCLKRNEPLELENQREDEEEAANNLKDLENFKF